MVGHVHFGAAADEHDEESGLSSGPTISFGLIKVDGIYAIRIPSADLIRQAKRDKKITTSTPSVQFRLRVVQQGSDEHLMARVMEAQEHSLKSIGEDEGDNSDNRAENDDEMIEFRLHATDTGGYEATAEFALVEKDEKSGQKHKHHQHNHQHSSSSSSSPAAESHPSSSPMPKFFVHVKARVMGEHKGTPALHPWVHLLGFVADADTEAQSDA